MNIKFYKNHSENIVADKTLTDETALTGALYTEDVSVVAPVIEVYGNPSAFNYCYIEDFNRYYYITDIRIVTSEHFIVSLKCDVLKSFLSNIRNCPAIVTRNKDNLMSYLDDGEYTTERRMRIQAKGKPTTDGGTVGELTGATWFLQTF